MTPGVVSCPGCGTQVAETASFCHQCGRALPARTGNFAPPPYALIPEQQRSNASSGNATAALVLGLLAFPLCGVGLVGSILAIVFGSTSLRLQEPAESMARGALVLGWVGIFWNLFWLLCGVPLTLLASLASVGSEF